MEYGTAALPVPEPLFGVAYYDEYMPRGVDRLEEDMRMMRDAGINVIRIAESTWSTLEPQPGTFDFTHVDRVLDAAGHHGLHVIVGTPTYAVPAWLAARHPQVLADTADGPARYGARQLVDIVDPMYLFHAERVIRVLAEHVAGHRSVIGFQLDNETKHYGSVSRGMQRRFVQHLRERFGNDFDALNAAFGLDYWSNRVDAWEDFPDLAGSVNESLRAAFDRFRREQVTAFLAWQAGIVREYARDDQFVTQNFDFEWRGHSYGIQPAVDHFHAADVFDVVGVDIYHPGEDDLTGKEIAFGGDVIRSAAGGANYLVLETQAQGQHGWLPYPGQLRLQAYSHVASGAQGVMYWHWHSIHHSFETYWKGLLSHDFEPNPTYREASLIGAEFADEDIRARAMHLAKHNKVALVVSNQALDALSWFRMATGFPDGQGPDYNDVVRSVFDTLYDLNVEVDFLTPEADAGELGAYGLVIAPALYCAPEAFHEALRGYVQQGGHLLATLRSFVADEDIGVWPDRAPHRMTDLFGMHYNQFTRPKDVGLAVEPAIGDERPAWATTLIELLMPEQGTEWLAAYDHPVWNAYAAVTRKRHPGGGWAEWMGTLPDRDTLRDLLRDAVERSVGTDDAMALAGQVTVRRGTNVYGEQVTYLFNYGGEERRFVSPVSGTVVVPPVIVGADGRVDEITTGVAWRDGTPGRGDAVRQGQELMLPAWGMAAVVGEQETLEGMEEES